MKSSRDAWLWLLLCWPSFGCGSLSTEGKDACNDVGDCLSGYACIEHTCTLESRHDSGANDTDARTQDASREGGSGDDDAAADSGQSDSQDAAQDSGSDGGMDGGPDSGVDTGTPPAVSECGDREISGEETCDDGNARAEDGCSDSCSIEPDYFCVAAGEGSACALCGPIFVDADSAAVPSDGLTWSSAYRELQPALALAGARLTAAGCARVEIWIAEGVYTPAEAGQRTTSFDLISGIELYGGFAGDETSRGARDWVAHPTVLSGDLNRDDQIGGDASDNAHHVVTATLSGELVLDGLIIERGQANGAAHPHFQGAGLYLRFGHPLLRDVLIRLNGATHDGGGLYLDQSDAELVRVEVRDNNAIRGAGVYSSHSDLELRDCTILFNIVSVFDGEGFGAGMYADGGSLELLGARFEANQMSGFSQQRRAGAGLYLNGTDAYIDGGLFATNEVNARTYGSGGAIHAEGGSSLVIVRTVFNENYAVSDNGYARGGAVMSTGGTLHVASTSFWNNTAGAANGPATGGAVHHEQSDTTWTNVLFGANQARAVSGQLAAGGALYTADGNAALVNTTLIYNSTCISNLCVGPISSPSATITNSILWQNGGGVTGPSSIDHSCIDEGNFDESDPEQTNRDDCSPLNTGALPDESTAIDRGDTAALPADADDLDGDGDVSEPLPSDLNGAARVIGTAVDMGAIEHP